MVHMIMMSVMMKTLAMMLRTAAMMIVTVIKVVPGLPQLAHPQTVATLVPSQVCVFVILYCVCMSRRKTQTKYTYWCFKSTFISLLQCLINSLDITVVFSEHIARVFFCVHITAFLCLLICLDSHYS